MLVLDKNFPVKRRTGGVATSKNGGGSRAYRFTNRWSPSTSRMKSSAANLQQNTKRTGIRFLSLFTPRISSTTFQQLSSSVSGNGTTCAYRWGNVWVENTRLFLLTWGEGQQIEQQLVCDSVGYLFLPKYLLVLLAGCQKTRANVTTMILYMACTENGSCRGKTQCRTFPSCFQPDARRGTIATLSGAKTNMSHTLFVLAVRIMNILSDILKRADNHRQDTDHSVLSGQGVPEGSPISQGLFPRHVAGSSGLYSMPPVHSRCHREEVLVCRPLSAMVQLNCRSCSKQMHLSLDLTHPPLEWGRRVERLVGTRGQHVWCTFCFALRVQPQGRHAGQKHLACRWWFICQLSPGVHCRMPNRDCRSGSWRARTATSSVVWMALSAEARARSATTTFNSEGMAVRGADSTVALRRNMFPSGREQRLCNRGKKKGPFW